MLLAHQPAAAKQLWTTCHRWISCNQSHINTPASFRIKEKRITNYLGTSTFFSEGQHILFRSLSSSIAATLAAAA
jgi:hypothetical protein